MASRRDGVRSLVVTDRIGWTVAALAAACALALAGASAALACVCAQGTMEERLDRADAAVVGRVTAVREAEVAGAPRRLLSVSVEQRVKGDLGGELAVRTPSRTSCDVSVRGDRSTGLLLTKAADGAWEATLCDVVDPGELVVAGGEPRGGPIKVVVGLVILALVLLWSFRRLRRGARPELPGPPLV